MVTGEQAPQLAVANDGDGKRRPHAHVLQILDMDGRDGARHGQRQVQYGALAVQHRQNRNGNAVDIGNDAENIAQVKRARLWRNIGCRVMQSQEGIHAGAQRLGHHLARALRVEAINLHPVKTGQRPHLPRTFAQECLKSFGLADTRNHGAHHGGGLHVLHDGGLGLDDNRIAGKMQRHVECRATSLQRHAEQALYRIGAAQQRDAVADVMDGMFGKQRRQGLADHALRIQPRETLQVGRGPHHEPVRAERDQEAEILDIAQDVDWLTLTIGEVYFLAWLNIRRGHPPS